MPGTRGLIVFLLVLAAASACSPGTPTGPSSTGTDQSTQPAGPPAPPAPPSPPAPPDSPEPPAGSAGPTITTQPKSQTIETGDDVTLSVKATGNGPLAYQWYTGSSGQTSSPVGGATSDRFTTPSLTKTTRYWVRVSNAAGSSDSHTATITVDTAAEPPAAEAPDITSQPKDRTVQFGQSATLSVSATGTAPLTYRWYQGHSGDTSSPINGAKAASYTTPSLTATTRYWVRVSNSVGATDSDDATIVVSVPEGNSSFEQSVLELVNDRRADGATCGGTAYAPTAALTLNTKLRTAARGHSQDMAANNYVSHTSLDGRTVEDRIRDAGYTGSYPLGENIGAGQSSPSAVVSGWMSSTGHCANIMNPAFRAIGIGYAYESNSTYRHYWTVNFGGS